MCYSALGVVILSATLSSSMHTFIISLGLTQRPLCAHLPPHNATQLCFLMTVIIILNVPKMLPEIQGALITVTLVLYSLHAPLCC